MKEIKAFDFPEVYKWLGINLNTLGCVMAPLELIDEPEFVKPYLYKSPHPERFWIDGWVASKKAHMTLLYGLTNKAQNLYPHIEKVLEGWHLDSVDLNHIDYFPCPYPDENYWCIIAHIEISDALLEGRQRLCLLPHINTFPTYKPHMTLGYIQCNEEKRDEIIKQTSNLLFHLKKKKTGTLDVGRRLKVNWPLDLGRL